MSITTGATNVRTWSQCRPKANSAKSSLSYEEIADLVEHQDHVAQLDCAETKKLWATVSTFFRADRDNILNRNNFYQGFPGCPRYTIKRNHEFTDQPVYFL